MAQPEINNSDGSALKVGSSTEFEREIPEEDVLFYEDNLLELGFPVAIIGAASIRNRRYNIRR